MSDANTGRGRIMKKWLKGHNNRGTGHINQGYRRLTRNGVRQYEHRIVMERDLGRRLYDDEVVHHKNHDRLDNRIENLEVMTFEEHGLLHQSERRKEPYG